MIVYRPQERLVLTAAVLKGLEDAVELHDLIIRMGEFESAIADLFGDSPGMRTAAVALGRQIYRSHRGLAVSLGEFRHALPALRRLELPREIRLPVLEGYAFYGLYPEMYVEAARQFFEECAPREVCVIGIRSIGASLSAVVAGTLAELGCAVQAFTVRPQGHPFDRHLKLAEPFPRDSQFYAVVDEGPGLSGSSFISVADHLPRDRTVLFPSWAGDPGLLVNERAREVWPLYRKYCTAFKPGWILGDAPRDDLSCGKWRRAGGDIAVQPQHEALKYRTGSSLLKFEGLGAYGRARYERACVLGDRGFSPRAEAFDRGFVRFEMPSSASPYGAEHPPPARIAGYLAFRSRRFPAGRSMSFDQIAQMIRVNAGCDLPLESYRTEFEDRPAVAVDGRMMPHEWIRTTAGWLKTDSVDHSSDHFYPGCADIAWDLAGAVVEHRMTAGRREALLRSYRNAAGDRVSSRICSFYEVAYLAFRRGYSFYAAQATWGTPDHDRFSKLEQRYRQALKRRTAPRVEEAIA